MSQQTVWKATGLITLLACANCGSEEATTERSVTVQLAEPTSTADLRQILQEHDARPTEFMFESHGITGGYTLAPGDDVTTAIDKMLSRHGEFLENMIPEWREEADREHGKGTSSETFANLLVLQDEMRQNAFKINKVRLLETSAVRSLLNSGIAVLMDEEVTTDARIEEPEAQITPKSYNHELWSPYSGTTQVTTNFTYNTFKFMNNVFGSSETYEHETQIYDGNFVKYDNYWSSNMPSAYYDTTACDNYTSPDIDIPTVGTFDANKLVPFTFYFTYMRLKAQTSKTATVRIKGQKGTRYCYSNLCVFSNATTASFTTFTAPITSSRSWTW